MCHEAGISVEPQVVIRDDAGNFIARVDFLLMGSRVIVEFDGMDKYASPDVLHAEKRRQVAIERLGYRVVRLMWRDLEHPRQVVRLISDAVQMAA